MLNAINRHQTRPDFGRERQPTPPLDQYKMSPLGTAGPSHIDAGLIGPSGSAYRDTAYWREMRRAELRAKEAKELESAFALISEIGQQMGAVDAKIDALASSLRSIEFVTEPFE